MASAPVLADPSVMTAQERTNELVASVERDDLLAVLLVLGYCQGNEINGRASPFGMSPIESALLYPTTRTPVRQLIAECLLQRGATANHLVQRMPAHALPAIESILKLWGQGGRDHATTSYHLCFGMDIWDVEKYLQEHDLGPDGPLDPPSTPAAPLAAPVALAPASPSPSPRRRPSPQLLESASSTLHESASRDAPMSSRREGPSALGPSSGDDRHRSDSAHRLSRAESPRREPRRRSRSPDRRDPLSRGDRDRRSPSPRREPRSFPTRIADHSRRSSAMDPYVDDQPARTSRPQRDSSPPSRARAREQVRASAQRRGFDDDSSVPTQRSPSRSPHALDARREPTPPPPELKHWLFVGGLPQTVAERFIYDHLTGIGIVVHDIFLSQSHHQQTRFAYVAVQRATDIVTACSSLRRLRVDERNVLAKPFRDAETGSSVPQASSMDLKRQYVGSERQASRPLVEHRVGLSLLHVSRSAQRSDVIEFLQRCLRADEIGRVEVKPLGTNVLAFVLMRDEAHCRRAIRQLDGECFCGQAVRVGWLELDLRHAHSRRSQDTVPHRMDDFDAAAANRAPLKTNRYEQLAAAGAKQRDDPPSTFTPSASIAAPSDTPITSSTSLTSSACAELAAAPSATALGPPPTSRSPTAATVGSLSTAPLPPPTDTATSVTTYELDVDRLRSIGLSPEQVDAVEQMWRPVGSHAEQLAERSMDVKVDFGCVAQDDARLALALDNREPAFPHDPALQARYTAFLEAHAGGSRDYYTVFFAQLAEFNSASAAFAERARAAAEAACRVSENSMDVDERGGVKQEERC